MPTKDDAAHSFFVFVKDVNTGKISRVAFPGAVQVGMAGNPTELSVLGSLSVNVTTYRTAPANNGIINLKPYDTVACIINAYTPSTNIIRVNLPAKPRDGQLHFIKDVSGSAGNARIDVYGSADGKTPIDGSASPVSMTTPYDSCGFVWSGPERIWILLTKTGTSGGGGATNGAGGGAASLYPLDSHDKILWKFDDTTPGGPYLNYGTIVGYDATQLGTAGQDIPCQFGRVTQCVFHSGWSYLGGPAGTSGNLSPTGSFTVAGWFKLLAASDTLLFYKRYRITGSAYGWFAPFATVLMTWHSDNTTSLYLTLGPDGAGTRFQFDTPKIIPYGEWVFVGLTFDQADSKYRVYVNGNLVYTSPAFGSSTIDWNNAGADACGSWCTGSDPNNSEYPNTYVNALRVCDVARPGSWFTAVFAAENGRY